MKPLDRVLCLTAALYGIGGKEHHMDNTDRIIEPPICVDCKRLHKAVYGKWGMFCDAFPDGIPDAIMTSRADHRQPVEGDHGVQFLAKSPEAAAAARRIIAEAHASADSKPLLRDLDLSNDWLYAWGDLPTNLHDLKQWLKEHDIAMQAFKNSARYEANYDQFPWLKDL